MIQLSELLHDRIRASVDLYGKVCNCLKKGVIVTGGTSNDVAAMAVLALNIRETNPNLADEMVIYHNGISPKDQRLINEIIPAKFIVYHCPVKIKNNKINSYFTYMLFCKYECINLLEDYEYVVWTDYDVLIRRRLTEIEEARDEEKGITIVVNTEVPIRNMLEKEIKNTDIDKYDLNRESLCTPLFVLNRNLRNPKQLCQWCYEKTNEYQDDLVLAEQCIFSLLVQEFHLQYKALQPEIYSPHPNKAAEEGLILHAYGQPKFWNGLFHEKWDFYYQQWKGMGGSGYYKYNQKPTRVESQIQYVLRKIKLWFQN